MYIALNNMTMSLLSIKSFKYLYAFTSNFANFIYIYITTFRMH